MQRLDRNDRRGGFTILEILIAVVALAIVVGGLTTSLVTSNALVQSNQEQAIAMDAAASMLAELRSADFAEAFANYNASPDDDPLGPGTAPGASFEVVGLAPRAGDADGRVGSIMFPGDGTVLLEGQPDVGLGMPRDLDGDGAIEAVEHTADYLVLPVRVRIEWNNGSGVRGMELVTTLVAQ